MKTKLITFIAGVMCLTFAGCRQQTGPTESQSPKAKVIIIKPMEHPSLGQCIQGFKDGLQQETSGTTGVEIEELSANGNFANIPALTKSAISRNPKVIFTVTTSAAAEAIKLTDAKVPLVYSAVTDPVKAGIVSSLNRSTTLATGTTDRYPTKEQVALFTALAPNAKTFAILFNPGEPNSQILSSETKQHLQSLGRTVQMINVDNASAITPATKNALGQADALIVNGDNTITENLQEVIRLCVANKKPLFVGDPDSVRKGAVGTVGPSYYDIGRRAGEKAARIVKGEDAHSISSEDPNRFDTIVNVQAAEAMGLNIPADFWKSRPVWENIYRTAQ